MGDRTRDSIVPDEFILSSCGVCSGLPGVIAVLMLTRADMCCSFDRSYQKTPKDSIEHI